MEHIELIITIVSFLIVIAGMLIKYGKDKQKMIDDINTLKDKQNTVDIHSEAIHELKTEMATIRSTFTNIDLKIEHLTNKHEETQALIIQVQKDNHDLHTKLIETINNVTMKS